MSVSVRAMHSLVLRALSDENFNICQSVHNVTMWKCSFTCRKACEGGLLESFGKDGRSAVLLREDTKLRDNNTAVMETVVEKYVKYFKSILHHNQVKIGEKAALQWFSGLFSCSGTT